MALIARQRTGRGQRISTPLFHAMFTLIGPAGSYVTAKGLHEPTPIDPHGSGVYQCGDGRYIQFDPNQHRFLVWFAEAAGITHWGPELLDAERLKERAVNDRLHQKLAELFLTRSAEEWEKLANDGGAVLAAIRTSKEWLATEHARQSGASVHLDDPEFGPTWMAGLPVRLVEAESKVQGPRRRPDADRAEILAELDAPRMEGDGHRGAMNRGANDAGANAAGANADAPATADAPLAGLRVLDLTQVFAGPTSGRLLAEFGADVVKINGPQRRITSHGYMNRAKRSILLDVESSRGQQVFWKLVEQADVVIQNFPPGTAERYGIGYSQVRARKSDVIYASLSCYGHGGPWQPGRGYERQGQAVTGVMDRVGTVPAILGPYNLVDIGTGVLTAFAIGLAVFHRLRTGQGQHVLSSLAQTAMYHQTPFMLDYEGKTYDEPRGWEALGTGPLQRFYQARDGWFFLGARPSETGRIGEVVGVAGLAGLDDGALAAALEERFVQDDRAVWVGRLQEAGVSAHAVVKLPQVMTDPWVRAHGLSVNQHSEEVGEVTYPGPSTFLSETPARIGQPARQPGADGVEILGEVGLADEVAALEQQWVLQATNLPRGW
jgi:crotonobetainyl-CoA:carnitine CoA-transferase CaiB-like acyl-CoA transferase